MTPKLFTRKWLSIGFGLSKHGTSRRSQLCSFCGEFRLSRDHLLAHFVYLVMNFATDQKKNDTKNVELQRLNGRTKELKTQK